MTPSSSPEVIIGAVGGYYDSETPSAGSGYTIPSGTTANGGSNGTGMVSLEYQICSSSCGTAFTPSFGISGTDYTNLLGATFGSGSQVAAPTFSPTPGTYSTAQNVSISTATSGATIYYTTNGTTPSPTNGTQYSGPITVSTTETVQAIAYETGMIASSVASATYAITSGGPTFVSGTSTVASFHGTEASLPAITTTAGNLLFVAITTASGNGCSATFNVSSKAGGNASGDTFTAIPPSAGVSQTYQCLYGFYASSVHGSSNYVITATVASGSGGSTAGMGVLQFSGVALVDQTCSGDANSGTSVSCSGSMTPSSSPEIIIGAVGGYYHSDIPSAGSGYTIPSGSTANGSSNGTGMVSLEYQICSSGCATAFTPSFAISGTNYTNLLGATFESGQVATPTFSPSPGTYLNAQSVTISDATSGATTYYTTNGTTPSQSNGTVYTGPVTVNATTTINAIAYKTGLANSAVASATYTIQPVVATPTFSPVAGTYTSAQSVTISTATSGATIYYTTNGTAPSPANGTQYSGPIAVSTSETIQAIGVLSGWTNSSVASASYTITATVATPTFSPGAGTYPSAQTVTISTATQGATIYYTTNGTAPSQANGTQYTGPITVSTSETVQAIGVLSGWTSSSISAAAYTISVSVSDTLYIADSGNQRVRMVTSTGVVTTIAGNGTAGYTGDGGLATIAEVNGPTNLALDSAGNLYIVDAGNSVVRKLTVATGITTTVAGNGTGGYTGDGGPATSAQLNPAGIAVDSAGNLYIADEGDQVIRKVTASTGIITTVAGNGMLGYAGDGGPATNAKLAFPAGLAVDSSGNLYIADSGNSVVRKVAAATGIISTVAGGGTRFGDGGPATSAILSFPTGVALDSAGNLYIADPGNADIRKVTAATGFITTVAGNGATGYSGDGGPATRAELNGAINVALDTDGNIYIDDSGNNVIRKVTATSGVITTVAGNGIAGYSGDGGAGGSAELNGPAGVAFAGGLPEVATPTLSPAAGTYTTAQTVTISTTTSGASIRYTADGSVPSETAGTLYSGAITVSASEVINAIAYETGFADSYTASAAYFITPTGGGGNTITTAASLSSTFSLSQHNGTLTATVISSLGTVNSGSVTFTVLNGSTQVGQTVTGSVTNGSASGIYPLTATPAGTYTIQAVYNPGSGFSPSSGSATLTIVPVPVTTPTFNLPSATYPNAQSVTISSTTPSASIRYTTDGSMPSETAGTLYSGPITVNTTTTINAIAYESGYLDSAIATVVYAIMPPAATPTFSPVSGTYTTSQTVTITSATSGASIRYTIDGTTPTETAGTLYSGPIAVSANQTLTAIAYASGYADTVASASYTIFSPGTLSFFISDSSNGVIRQVTIPGGIITTVAGNGEPAYGGDTGPATSAELGFPQTTVIDGAGNLYIADSNNSVIRKVTAATGAINTIAGNGTSGYAGDGGPATSAELGYLLSIFLDSYGNIYIADFINNVVRKVTAASGLISTIAGNGTVGYMGDSGPAIGAELNGPFGVALDSAGNLYIADSNNNVIREVVAATGVINTIAGNGTAGYIGDSGPATSAELNTPVGVVLDSAANLYIADSSNNVIRKVTAATGVINTIVGNATAGYSGDGGPANSAELNQPYGLAFDTAGNLYIADSGNNVIRQVTTATGVITTIAGNGTPGYIGDGGLATSAELDSPDGVAFGAALHPPTQVIPPTFSPAAGTYAATQTVTIASATPGVSINYTTNGSTPSSTVGTPYTGPLTVSSTTTINAFAFATGYTGAIATAVYSLQGPPSVTSVSPTFGAAGTQVTLSGSNFGSTQGNGVVFLGTNIGAIVSWSNAQIVAVVSTGATSGTASVEQGGVLSNGVPFTVNTATISSISPNTGLPGTQVTISGSGFGSSQFSSQVFLGTAAGVVQTWSDAQIVATVGTGAATGNALVIQNGAVSNQVPFTVNTPQITGVTPISGASGTSITITGSGFGASQGSGTILLGSMPGVVQSWSDTQVVAGVALGSLTGIVQIQQNGYTSNAMTFTVSTSGGNARPRTLPGGSNLTLIPNLINMQVGDTRTIQALNASGQSVTGLTWASSNSSVVSLSTDDPPILTALATGQATITAGSAATVVTVFTTIPLGTVLWSSPGDGSGVAQIVPAVPSPTGVADVFALQNDGTIQAITSDGTVAWTYALSPPFGPQDSWGEVQAVPDFQGGIVVSDSRANGGAGSIMKIDGITGQAYPSYSPPANSPVGGVVVHTDGTIFATQTFVTGRTPGGNPISYSAIVGIDPTTGAQQFLVAPPLPEPYLGVDGQQCSTPLNETYFQDASVGPTIVAGDGYAYAQYGYLECGTQHTFYHLRLLRISSSGTFNEFTIADVQTKGAGPGGGQGSINMISNADTGVVFTWSAGPSFIDNARPRAHSLTIQSLATFGMAVTNGTTLTPVSLPTIPNQSNAPVPLLQREDGSIVGTVRTVDNNGNPLPPSMVAFDTSGSVLWVAPNETPQIATADGGVIGQSGITYDQNGNATGQIANLPTYSWLNNAYQIGSVDQIAANPLLVAMTFWALQGGSYAGGGTAVRADWFPPLPDSPHQAIYNALSDLVARLKSPTPIPDPSNPGQTTTMSALAQQFVFNIISRPAGSPPYTIGNFIAYLTKKKPGFYNGLKSSYCYTAVADGMNDHAFCNGTSPFSHFLLSLPIVGGIFASTTVAEFFQTHPGTGGVTGTPSNPLVTYFDPAYILPSSAGKNLGNEAAIFHEALHGFTKLQDFTLLSNFGYSLKVGSCNIEVYLRPLLTLSAGLDSAVQPCQ